VPLKLATTPYTFFSHTELVLQNTGNPLTELVLQNTGNPLTELVLQNTRNPLMELVLQSTRNPTMEQMLGGIWSSTSWGGVQAQWDQPGSLRILPLTRLRVLLLLLWKPLWIALAVMGPLHRLFGEEAAALQQRSCCYHAGQPGSCWMPAGQVWSCWKLLETAGQVWSCWKLPAVWRGAEEECIFEKSSHVINLRHFIKPYIYNLFYISESWLLRMFLNEFGPVEEVGDICGLFIDP
jgi:hypothetical protein